MVFSNMGSIIIRGTIMVLGYLYPAYECFKCVEKKRPDQDHIRFWCQYWMIIAVVTVAERLGDALISWIPLYSEAKLAFIIYLWYPKTKGTTYIYSTFVRPFVAQHEEEIDQNLKDMKSKAGDYALFYWYKSSAYVQARFFELLQYLAAQQPPPESNAPPIYPPPLKVDTK
ncbi:unnamed protein product [Calypogeia fissa]